MTAVDRDAAVMGFIRERLSTRTKVPIEQIDETSGLIALGLQSIDAVLLCGEVEEHFEVELNPSTIFEHDTVGGFVSDVLSRLNS